MQRDRELERQAQTLGEMLSGQPLLDISYEELSADTAGAVRRVAAFLGLAAAPADVKPALSKVGAADLRDTVSNYEELLAHPATRALLLAD